MCTINALCLTTLTDHLNQLLAWKHQYGRERVNFTLNILRFPSFQSALVLSDVLRTRFNQRLIDYLDVVKTPHSDAFDMPKLLNDFKQFHTQYDHRRSKHFGTAFPELKEWYNSL